MSSSFGLVFYCRSKYVFIHFYLDVLTLDVVYTIYLLTPNQSRLYGYIPITYIFILLQHSFPPCKYPLVLLVIFLWALIINLKAKSYDNFIGAAAVKTPAAKDTEKELYNASLSATEVASSLSTSLKNHQQLKEAEQLMEIEKLRQKLESTERAMAQLVAEMNTDQYEAKVSIEPWKPVTDTDTRYRYKAKANDSDTFT